jgi:hypothetical protein
MWCSGMALSAPLETVAIQMAQTWNSRDSSQEGKSLTTIHNHGTCT